MYAALSECGIQDYHEFFSSKLALVEDGSDEQILSQLMKVHI